MMKNWDRNESGSEFDDDESQMSSSSEQQQLPKCNSQEQQDKNGGDKEEEIPEEEIPCTLHSRFVILPDQMVHAKHRKSAGYMSPEFYRLLLFRIHPFKFNPVSSAAEKKMLKQINKCWHPMITQTVLDNDDEIAPAPSVAHNRLYRYECYDCCFQLNGFPFVPLVYLICDHFIDCPTHLVQPDIREKFLRERESFHAFFGPDFNHDFLLPTDGSAILTFHPFHPLDTYHCTVKMSPDYCAKRAQQFEEWLEKDYALIHDEEFVEEIEDEEEDEVEDEEDENEADEEMMEMEENIEDIEVEEKTEEEKMEEAVKEVVLATNLLTKEVGHPIKKKAEENMTPTCEYCGETFAKQWQLNLHVRKHTLPFECDWPGCGRKFAQDNNCKNHRKTHRNDHRLIKKREEGEMALSCEYCGETFMKQCHLNLHVRKHTLPFECDWPGCERKFARNDNCKRHMKTHRNDRPLKKNGVEELAPSCERKRPFVCPICGKAFKMKEYLIQHRNKWCATRVNEGKWKE